MTATKKGWNRSVMASLFTKEATYDAGVTMNGTNACSLTGFELDTSWDDTIVNDKAEVTGKEHGYDQDIISYGSKFGLKIPKVTPNALAGFASLALGSTTTTKDGAYNAWRHKIIPVAVGTALPSIHIEDLFGGLQYKYTGVKCSTLKLSGEAGGLLSMEASLVGSGTRATSATAMAAAISESWMKLTNCKVWLESGANISIDATLTQGLENISGATPDNLYPRLKNFEWTWDNALENQPGFGQLSGALQDIDYGRRKCGLKFSLIFNDGTELAYYTAQDACAIEFDLKGAIVIASSSMYFGAHIVVPRFKIKSAPLPKGGPNDTLTQDFDCEVFDDGTNAASIIEVYNAKSTYLA
jgi:hypothetical protein